MRVAYITSRFPHPSETFACTDVRVLREAGVEVVVHSLKPHGSEMPALMAERGLDAIETSYNSMAATLRGLSCAVRWPRLTLETMLWLARYTWTRPRDLLGSLAVLPRSLDILARVRQHPPDVVHLFWGHYPAIVGRLVQRTVPEIVVSMFLGAYDLVWGYGPSAPVAREADVTWTHAACNLPDLARLGAPPDRVVIAYRGVDLSQFSATVTPKIRYRIISAGRLVYEKHTDDVLIAFNRARQWWPEATLVIMGDGPDRPRLEQLARSLGLANAVSFAGHVPHDQVRREMQLAEVFILMSRDPTDRLTNALKEAMASRCVCVVARTRGVEELVADGVHGYVVSPGDVDALVKRIDSLFRDPVRRQQIAAAGAEHVRAHFDVRQTMALYRRRWAALLDERRRAPVTIRSGLRAHDLSVKA